MARAEKAKVSSGGRSLRYIVECAFCVLKQSKRRMKNFTWVEELKCLVVNELHLNQTHAERSLSYYELHHL